MNGFIRIALTGAVALLPAAALAQVYAPVYVNAAPYETNQLGIQYQYPQYQQQYSYGMPYGGYSYPSAYGTQFGYGYGTTGMYGAPYTSYEPNGYGGNYGSYMTPSGYAVIPPYYGNPTNQNFYGSQYGQFYQGYPTGRHDAFGSPLCNFADYPVATPCQNGDPQQWIQDPYTGQWY